MVFDNASAAVGASSMRRVNRRFMSARASGRTHAHGPARRRWKPVQDRNCDVFSAVTKQSEGHDDVNWI